MFCYQCQETAKNQGCTVRGVCGKESTVADLQDLVIYLMKGISYIKSKDKSLLEKTDKDFDHFVLESVFSTITNANFDQAFFINRIKKAVEIRDNLMREAKLSGNLPDACTWKPANDNEIIEKSKSVGYLSEPDLNKRSLKTLILLGIKGITAYGHHAFILNYADSQVISFMYEMLAFLLEDKSQDDLIKAVIRTGEFGVKTMAILDKANTETYGNPEPTIINIGTRNNPGILISGHDLKDLEELLNQTQDTGIDVYTHGEMLPSHNYPFFKKYKHFVGNYGDSWWKQIEEFETFNGPILLTSNCLVPPKPSYKDRVYTTGAVGFEGVTHIPDRKKNGTKDFSKVIAHAKKCKPPKELEKGSVVSGFGHHTLFANADKILDLVGKGKIKRFVVMGGCDGRFPQRSYYTEFAKKLPKDTIILTAGCAKFRYNKLELGDIEGIPRVIDAGQCNDSYSLAILALKLAEILKTDVNKLPIVYNIAWYEQKAVLVLLALLSLGIKNIHVGPTIPAFLSPDVADFIIKSFNLGVISTVEEDMKKFALVG